MGLLFSSCSGKFSDNPCRILMLGLDAAGKTTILYKLKSNEPVTTIPTIGFNEDTLTPIPGVTFNIWDVGGEAKIRKMWNEGFAGTEGILFVVDSIDKERVTEARDELFRVILDSEMMLRVPVVIIANKQDQPVALPTSKLIDLLDLQKLPGNPWHIQAACALNGDGLKEATSELAKMVKQFRKKRR